MSQGERRPLPEAKFWIKASPKALQTEALGWEENFLKVKIRAVREKGNANDELISYLSSILNVAKPRISLLKGHTSKIKQVQIDGISIEEIKKKIEDLLL